MIVIIDNYDSFTFNIVQTLATCPPGGGSGWCPPDIRVFRNDKVTVEEIAALQPDRLLVSPGPGEPKDAGISIEAIRYFSSRIPVLGVCLGHQAIGEAFGGRVIRAERVMHGKTSLISHDDRGVFTGLENPFDGMRYHSLVVDRESLPACLTPTAFTRQGVLMGLRHKELPVEGVQFHPESIMTGVGIILLHNFLRPDYPELLQEKPARNSA